MDVDTRTKEEKIEAVLAELNAGVPGLVKACEKAGVNRSNFLFWVDNDPELAIRYERARACGQDALAEEIINLADEMPSEVNTAFGTHLDSAAVAWRRNQIDARKWLLSKIAPKKYGDRIEVEHSGAIRSAPLDAAQARKAAEQSEQAGEV